ncbi:MAG: hypothetical protein LC772_13220, partial [Chloroflexi bacterium]|nr:hypothetical protein [Chloroflexota bacterium]
FRVTVATADTPGRPHRIHFMVQSERRAARTAEPGGAEDRPDQGEYHALAVDERACILSPWKTAAEVVGKILQTIAGRNQ